MIVEGLNNEGLFYLISFTHKKKSILMWIVDFGNILEFDNRERVELFYLSPDHEIIGYS